MRFVRSILAAGLVLAGVSLGCKSGEESGVKTDYHSQWTEVAADTKTTTEAAKAVLMSQELKEVSGESTAVDGMAMAKKADGTKVNVSIKKDGDMSKVSVTIGVMGDPTLGAQIARQIKDKAEMK